jgi:hypothetical protein
MKSAGSPLNPLPQLVVDQLSPKGAVGAIRCAVDGHHRGGDTLLPVALTLD